MLLLNIKIDWVDVYVISAITSQYLNFKNHTIFQALSNIFSSLNNDKKTFYMILQTITKAHWLTVCFKFSHALLFMQRFFVPGNYTIYCQQKHEISDPPVCKTASIFLSQIKQIGWRNLTSGVTHLICKTAPPFWLFIHNFY